MPTTGPTATQQPVSGALRRFGAAPTDQALATVPEIATGPSPAVADVIAGRTIQSAKTITQQFGFAGVPTAQQLSLLNPLERAELEAEARRRGLPAGTIEEESRRLTPSGRRGRSVRTAAGRTRGLRRF